MLLRGKSVIAYRPEFVVLDIAMLVDAVGNIVGRQVGNLREQFLELAGCLLLIGLQRRNGVLEFGDLRHQRAGAGIVLGALGFGDFLRGRVAARQRLLQLGDAGAAALVDRNETRSLERKAASLQSAIEGCGVVANPLDVVHGGRLLHHGRTGPATPIRSQWVAPSPGMPGEDRA